MDHEILLSLMDRSALDDRGLERLLGIHQTTLWRLKNGKIQKVSSYISVLREHLGRAAVDGEERLVEDLVALSRYSPKLRELLLLLRQFLQEPA